MERNDFITKYAALGDRIREWLDGQGLWPELDEAVSLSWHGNGFFTPYMQRRALEALADGFLKEEVLRKWLEKYPVPDRKAGGNICGVVAAGNIPAVGFHDILTVLAAGWKPLVKLSSKDRYLLPVLFPPESGVEYSSQTDGWKVDALLTMGGDNAAEFFRKRFGDIPKIIRSGRFSIAVLSGSEDNAALDSLTEDMLLYYGLGCRSVTCLLVPEGYSLSGMMSAAEQFAGARWGQPGKDIHRKNKAVLTLGGERFLDSGTVIFRDLREAVPEARGNLGLCRVWGQNLHAGEVWYAEYGSQEEVQKFIAANVDRIQKIIRNFGTAQKPSPDEWPDGADVLGMLTQI